MNIDAEIIDITNLDETPVINLNKGPSKQKSANFGDGIELLMNDKRKNDGGSKKMGTDIDLDDLNELENELNNLSSSSDTRTTHVKSKSSLFNQALNGSSGEDSIKLNFSKDEDISDSFDTINIDDAPSIGKFTSDKVSFGETKTWDGFGKFNNIPINPDREISDKPKMTNEELLLEKFKILRKLEELERKGVKLTKKYSMESPLSEMKGEYEMVIAEKERSNSCKFQGRMLMAAITGLEFLNNRFDPFDIKLDGWAEQLNENIDDYDEIFAELHEKYKSKAKMAPELKLLFQLGGSGIMVHMTNTMFKSAMPGMDDIMRQNPELAQQFTQAAVNSMGQQNPGFGGFMSNFMPGNSGGGGGAGVNFNNSSSANNMPSANHMRPPAPMPTQQSKSEKYAMPANRPDINRARNDDGIDIQEQFEPYGMERSSRSQAPARSQASERSQAPARSQAQAPARSQASERSQAPARSQASERSTRAEMKGPSDIGDLLAGLKTKTINVQPQAEPPTRTQQVTSMKQNINSATNGTNNTNVQQVNNIAKFSEFTKSKPRKQKSDRNTMSLDI